MDPNISRKLWRAKFEIDTNIGAIAACLEVKEC